MPQPDPLTIIKTRIKETGITQKELSFRADVSPAYMNDILMGKRRMTPVVARIIFLSLKLADDAEAHCVAFWKWEMIREWNEFFPRHATNLHPSGPVGDEAFFIPGDKRNG